MRAALLGQSAWSHPTSSTILAETIVPRFRLTPLLKMVRRCIFSPDWPLVQNVL
jgi:hypothetical protein